MSQNSFKIKKSLSLSPSSAPSSPSNGDVYYDSGTNLFMFYQNGVWQPIGAVRAGSVSVSAAATSQAVTFSSALPSTSYAISVHFKNLVDTYPQFQPLEITAQSTTGFTVSWNAPTDSANYNIVYTVTPNV